MNDCPDGETLLKNFSAGVAADEQLRDASMEVPRWYYAVARGRRLSCW